MCKIQEYFSLDFTGDTEFFSEYSLDHNFIMCILECNANQ